MHGRPAEIVPSALSVDDAMRDSATLARLRERLDGSRRRFEAIRDLLPAALAQQAEPGPLDDGGWTLLAANGAAAAKLRQLQPRLEERLAQQGWPGEGLRVRVRAAR